MALNGGGVSDLPQLLQKQNYDRISKTALGWICNVYVCGLHKRKETPVSVCDHMILLAAEQASAIFPKNFDSYVLRAIEKCTPCAPLSNSYTYDACLTWSTETRGVNFRNQFLKHLFEHDVTDCPVVKRLQRTCGVVLEELGLSSKQISVARGFVWAEMYVLNVQIAIVTFLKYGPKSDHFRPTDGGAYYTDTDIARLFFEIADGEDIHSRHDAVTVYHTPPSTAHGDVLPVCPICLEITHYTNSKFTSTKNAVVNCHRCLQPIHVKCHPKSDSCISSLKSCPCCRAPGEWLIDVERAKLKGQSGKT
ncbi:hypothetical protein CYMTET_38346 [Cymbomonas tetramitiformis]|uniref:Uncharacterized protein n=1 Tax=Cymbomonas tetramitiformis TaxID=36881 RepID=A0AAE0CC65_9CHLO|nr:hypothetical protein CYMTET_38346 [Cymbomonas tetramitiformis]